MLVHSAACLCLGPGVHEEIAVMPVTEVMVSRFLTTQTLTLPVKDSCCLAREYSVVTCLSSHNPCVQNMKKQLQPNLPISKVDCEKSLAQEFVQCIYSRALCVSPQAWKSRWIDLGQVESSAMVFALHLKANSKRQLHGRRNPHRDAYLMTTHLATFWVIDFSII